MLDLKYLAHWPDDGPYPFMPADTILAFQTRNKKMKFNILHQFEYDPLPGYPSPRKIALDKCLIAMDPRGFVFLNKIGRGNCRHENIANSYMTCGLVPEEQRDYAIVIAVFKWWYNRIGYKLSDDLEKIIKKSDEEFYSMNQVWRTQFTSLLDKYQERKK